MAPMSEPDGGVPDAPGAPRGVDISHPASTVGLGDVHGLAVNADRTRAYVGEGSQIAVLDLGNLDAPDAITPYAHPHVVAKVPIEAQIIGLTHDADTVLVAGGAFGLLAMSTLEPSVACADEDLGRIAGCFTIQSIDRRTDGAYAWDVAVAGAYVIAVFSAMESLGGSELRIYDRATFAPVRTVPVPTGIPTASAFGIEIVGDDVYLAMGTGGVIHTNLAALIAGTQISNIVSFDPANPPAGCSAPSMTVLPAERALVRDVAITGDSVWVAADMFGLVELDAATLAVRACTPLVSPAVATDTSFAVQVDAVGMSEATYIIVNGNTCAKAYEGGAPYSATGRMTYDLGVGGEAGSCSRSIEAQYVFAARPGAIALWAFHPGQGNGGGNFVVRQASATELAIYNQPVAYGLTTVAGVQPGLLAFTLGTASPIVWPAPDHIYLGRGLDSFGAFPLLGNPNFIVPFFEGSSGSSVAGEYIDLADPHAPQLVMPSSGDARPNNVLVNNAQWLDASAPDKEWFTSGYNHGIELVRTSRGSMCEVETFPLATPQDAECKQPRVYYGATTYETSSSGAMLLTMRSTSRYGAVLYNRDTLVARASTTTPGCQLYSGGACTTADICSPDAYEVQIDTHPELAGWTADEHHLDTIRPTFTWDAKTFTYTVDGAPHTFAAIAAGFNANNTDANSDNIPDDPNFAKPQLVLVDLDGQRTTRPGCAARCGSTTVTTLSPVAVVNGPSAHANAFSIELVEACARRYAFLGDFGGRVLVFDITDPFHPSFVSQWVAPVSKLDGHYENLLSVVVDYQPTWSEAIVYVSGFRSGLAKLRVGIQCDMAQPITFPADAWTAEGVERAPVPGLAHMLRRYDVGDAHGLVLGAKNGGVRFYGELADGTSPTCGP
jgi:hypothetical protein